MYNCICHSAWSKHGNLYIYICKVIYTQYKDSHYGMDGFISEKLGAIPIPQIAS